MSQIQKKWIANDAVGATQIRLENNQFLRGRNAANSADVSVVRVNAANVVEFASVPQITGTPSANADIANVQFVKDYANGIRDPKDAVRALQTTNLPLSGSTPVVVDGVTLVDQDRVGLIGQSSGVDNGIYVITVSGPTYTMARSTDADTSTEVTQGMSFGVAEGSVNQAAQVILVTTGPITIGVTSLNFILVPSAASLVGGDMISKTGSTLAVDLATTSGLESTNPGNVAGQLRVRISDAGLLQNKTTKISGTNAIEGLTNTLQSFTLSAGDITNGYLDLTQVAATGSIRLSVSGGPNQIETTDYTVNYTGGTGSKTRVTFAGTLASTLAATDVVQIQYQYL